MALRMPCFLALVVGFVLTAAGQQVITLNPVHILGDVVQVTQRTIVVKAGDGKDWALNLGNNTIIKVKGSAVPEMITPRVCVRFIASIDKKTCKAQDKVDKVTIFTPMPGVASRTLGVELAKDAAPEEDDEAGPGGRPPMGPPGMPRGPGRGPGGMPGQGAVPGQAPLPRQGPVPGQAAGAGEAPGLADPGIGDEPPAGSKSKHGKGPAATVPEVASYEVCAQVVSCHSRRLIVNVPNRFFKSKITAELSSDAEIALDVSDLSVVKAGDKVSATGYYITPGVCQQTNKLTITLANPLAPPGNHAHRPRPAVAKGDAAHPAGGKTKPESPPAGKKPVAEEDKPVVEEKPAEKPSADFDPFAGGPPKEKEENPAMDDPNAKPEPAPKTPDVKPEPAPKTPDVTPEPKKPDESPPKKPPEKDDEKDVSDK